MTAPDRCEWDPERSEPATMDLRSGEASGCQRSAEVIVGADGQWRLCSECAALPRFAKFKRREDIRAAAIDRLSRG